MTSSDSAADVAAAIREASAVFVACHENPDGDAIGSLLALRSMLLSLGKRVHAAAPTPPPVRFSFLAGFDRITAEPPPWEPDLGIALDCDGPERLGELKESLLAAATVVDMDHHRGVSAFGDILYVVPGAPATASLVMAVAGELGLSPTPEQATALYAALIADTGGFRFTNTSPEALRLGAELIAAGADPADLARRVFSVRPLAAARLEARALASLEMHDSIIIATLHRDDFAQSGADPSDTDGLIDSFRDVTGVQVAVLLKETEPDVWHVSLRGNGVNVASVAAHFGGGGHAFAAGCTLEGRRDGVTARLLEALPRAAGEEAGDA
ncbi:MAG: DHH family phosphoesterase [Armatimonadota bacterium]|nr:DHH family phosphoesterase [Armatimonadota bacterium]